MRASPTSASLATPWLFSSTLLDLTAARRAAVQGEWTGGTGLGKRRLQQQPSGTK